MAELLLQKKSGGRWVLGAVRKSDGRKYKIHALGSVIFPGRSARISQGQKEVDKRKTDDYNNMM